MNSKTTNTLLLIVRLIAGGIIGFAGYMKLTMMGGTEGVVAMFGGMGISPTVAWIVAIGEVLIGLGLIFGVWTRVAAVGAIIIMVGVFYYTKNWADYKAWAIGIGSLIVLFAGAGRFALCRGTCAPKAATSVAPAQPMSSVPPSNPQM